MKIVIIFLTVTTCQLFAQVQQEWVVRYNSPYNLDDVPEKMVLDKFGNVIVTGRTNTNNQATDAGTVKYSPSGVQQWVSTYNQNSTTNDQPRAIASDSVGNIFITGYTGYNLGPFDIMTIKYNSAGIQQWAKIYAGTAGNTDDFGTDVEVDRSGNIYVCGGTGMEYNPGNAVLIKYNTNGDSVWVRRYSIGGLTAQYFSMATDRFNNVYATGIYTTSTSTHCLTVKYDSGGVLQWAATYASAGADWSNKLALDTSGNVYIIGHTYISPTNVYVTIKYSNSGVQQWVRNYSGPNNQSYGTLIATDKSGNIYATGSSSRSGGRDIATIKYNSIGDSLWVRRYPGSGSYTEVTAIKVDDSSSIYLTGWNIVPNMVTLKYSATGVQQWVVTYPGHAVDNAVDRLGNIYVTGFNLGTGYDYVTIKYNQLSPIDPISNEVPNDFELYQNYPNPFNAMTKVRFQVAKISQITLTLFDVLGRQIETIINEQFRPGIYEVPVDASLYSSGVYYYNLTAGSYTWTKKMMLVK